MDGIQCLTQLQGDMSGWLEKVDFLTKTANLRYSEFTQMAQKANKVSSIRKAKNGSMESLRPQEEGEGISSPSPERELVPITTASVQPIELSAPGTPNPATKLDVDPHNRHLFREVREQRRKRKNPSLKDGASGPQRFRSRISLVIYYDSSIQEGFEKLVRNISGARNILRKGRVSASFKARFSSGKHEESPFNRNGSAYAYRLPTVPRIGTPSGGIFGDGRTGLEIYDNVDRELEAAQTLCEVGAHQFLRDGDCFDELEDTKKRFEKCIDLLNKEVKLLNDQAEQEKVLGLDSMENTSPSVARTNTQNIPTDISLLDATSISVDGPIEPDDNIDAESIEIDLSKIPGRRQYSSRHNLQVPKSGQLDGHVEKNGAFKDKQQNIQTTSANDHAPGQDNAAIKHTDAEGIGIPLEDIVVDNVMAEDIGNSREEPGLDVAALRNNVLKRQHVPEKQEPLMHTHHKSDETPLTGIAVEGMEVDGAKEHDSPGLDLDAMRSQVGKRSRKSQEVNGNGDGFEVDLAAMRAQIGHRGPTRKPEQVNGTRSSLDLAAMRSQIGRWAGKQEVKHHDANGNEIPLATDFAVDPALVVAEDEDKEEEMLPIDTASALKSLRKAQKA